MAGGMVSASDWVSDLGACKLQHTQALSAAIDGILMEGMKEEFNRKVLLFEFRLLVQLFFFGTVNELNKMSKLPSSEQCAGSLLTSELKI